MKFGGQLHTLRVLSPRLFLKSEEDVKAIYEAFEREYSERYSPFAVYPQGGVEILSFILRATAPTSKPQLPVYPKKEATPPKKASKGTRDVYWGEYGGFHKTPIYEQMLLEHGNIIEGPAVIEAESTTTVLPPGWKLSVDKYLNLILEKEG